MQSSTQQLQGCGEKKGLKTSFSSTKQRIYYCTQMMQLIACSQQQKNPLSSGCSSSLHLSNNATIAIASWLAKMLQLASVQISKMLYFPCWQASTVRLDWGDHIPIGKTHFLLRQHMQCSQNLLAPLQYTSSEFYLKGWPGVWSKFIELPHSSSQQ